jgi:hypothetical protein
VYVSFFLFSVFSYNSILILLLIILLQFAYCYSHMSFIDRCTYIRMSLSCMHFSVISLFFFQYSKTTPLPCRKYGIILLDVTQSLLCYFLVLRVAIKTLKWTNETMKFVL